jgi:hypothetical protein
MIVFAFFFFTRILCDVLVNRNFLYSTEYLLLLQVNCVRTWSASCHHLTSSWNGPTIHPHSSFCVETAANDVKHFLFITVQFTPQCHPYLRLFVLAQMFLGLLFFLNHPTAVQNISEERIVNGLAQISTWRCIYYNSSLWFWNMKINVLHICRTKSDLWLDDRYWYVTLLCVTWRNFFFFCLVSNFDLLWTLWNSKLLCCMSWTF